ncbi:alpha/beta fold hydrolase [Neobacillus sp. Marseille-QA0830]
MSFKTKDGEALFNTAYDHNLKQWPVAYDSFTVPTSYGQTHIIAAGEKHLPPLIMLHGAGMGATVWSHNIEILSKNHRVYCLDVMGDMNKSEPVKSFHKGEEIGRWVCEVLDELRIEKTDVVGHSAGGYAALNFVIYAQHRVNRAVLLAPAASFIPFHKQFFVRLAMINIFRSKAFIERFFCNWFVAKGHVISGYSFEQFIYGVFYYQFKTKPVIPTVIPKEKLTTIQVPVLMLMGEDEVIYNPKKAVASAKECIPHIDVKMITNASHCLFIEQAELVNQYMMDFLQ